MLNDLPPDRANRVKTAVARKLKEKRQELAEALSKSFTRKELLAIAILRVAPPGGQAGLQKYTVLTAGIMQELMMSGLRETCPIQ